MEPSYFGKIFKKEIGKNFTDYLIHFRIEKSKELLLTRIIHKINEYIL